MESSAPHTGIEIEMAYSPTITKVLHLFHLDGFVKGMFDSRTLVISLDGREQRVPMHTNYFVEAGAGSHQLAVAIGDFLGKASIAEPMSRMNLDVPVEAGRVTLVRYAVGVGGVTTFSVTGSRDG